MTIRFATLADTNQIRTNVNAWRKDALNADVYDAEGLRGLTAAEVAARIGGRVAIITQGATTLAYVLGHQQDRYIDGLPGVRLTEILANPAIPVGQRMAALALTMNDLATLLRGAGASRFVAETFEDSRMWTALKVLISQGSIPPITEVGSATREKPSGVRAKMLFLSWPL